MVHPKPNFVKHRPPTIGEFLRLSPLPSDIAHLEKAMRKLPSVAILIDIIAGAAEHHLSNQAFEQLIVQTGDLYSQPAQRCAACLKWTKRFHGAAVGTAEDFITVALCEQCERKTSRGNATGEMWRNLAAYTDGGAR